LDEENSDPSMPPPLEEWGDLTNGSFMDDNKNTLIVEVSYTDMFGMRQTVEKQVFINPLSGSFEPPEREPRDSEMSNGMLYIVVGVIGLVGIVLVLKYGKRKKK